MHIPRQAARSSIARAGARNKGFTLIELVVVIAVTGVLAVTAAVVIYNYKSSYLPIAANKIKSDIEHARGLAMMRQGTTYGVFFDDANDRYTVYQGSILTPVADPQTKQDLIETFSKWPGLSITGGDYTVEFDQFGAPSTGGGGGVTITDGSGTRTISVGAVTGKVTVQ
jgi:prepilin-type N-terminal cleavage/methylation domain-containing protein